MIALLLALIVAAPMQTNASWYGEAWRGRITASGEAFSPDRFTAASWDYPIGCALEITNAATGARVQVMVTDRGPAKRLVAEGRRLDLSQAAFARIAPLSVGVIGVRVEKINLDFGGEM